VAAATKRALTIAGRALTGLVLAVSLFALAGWIGSSIPRNPDWTEPEDGITIMVETNGVHTAIVMPLVSPQKDWRAVFPASDLGSPDLPYTHVSVSWGQREVFLDTPTWADLRPVTVWHAAFGSAALFHIAQYVRPAAAGDIRPIRLRPAEYERLVAAIEVWQLPRSKRHHHPGYYTQDAFYDASVQYHLGSTCNQWTSDMLAKAGVKTGLWTPFAGGVMKWIESVEVPQPLR